MVHLNTDKIEESSSSNSYKRQACRILNDGGHLGSTSLHITCQILSMHTNLSPYLFAVGVHQNMAEDRVHMNEMVKRPIPRVGSLDFGGLSAMSFG